MIMPPVVVVMVVVVVVAMPPIVVVVMVVVVATMPPIVVVVMVVPIVMMVMVIMTFPPVIVFAGFQWTFCISSSKAPASASWIIVTKLRHAVILALTMCSCTQRDLSCIVARSQTVVMVVVVATMPPIVVVVMVVTIVVMVMVIMAFPPVIVFTGFQWTCCISSSKTHASASWIIVTALRHAVILARTMCSCSQSDLSGEEIKSPLLIPLVAIASEELDLCVIIEVP